MFKLWFLVLQLQLTMLVFVRSIRSGNFPLYIQSLTKLVHWFFTFNHYHYAWWISVHLRDMMALSHLHPDIHTEFVKGHFTVKKTSHAFSNLAIDQAHEQNNAVVKDDGGAVGLTECPAALQRWMLSGPEIARVINDFERAVDCALCTSDTRHHEQRPGVQKISLQDVMSLKATIDEYSNPFLETSGHLLVLDTRDIVEKSVIANLYRIEALGCQHYDNFVSERLVERTIPIYDVMKKNNIHLFNTPHKRQKTKTSELVLSLKSDRNLFSRLYVASQFRDGNLDEFFSHENQPCPPSLSDRGKLKLGIKSDIVRCLEDVIEEQDDTTPSVEVVVLDGPAIVHMLKPAAARTFREYAQDVFLPYVSWIKHS